MAPPPVAVAIFTWTGIYVGVNVGYGWATGTSTATLTGNFFETATATGSGNLNGAIAGGQIGGNYQIGSFVLGLEVDAQWSGQKSTSASNCGFGCTLNETVEINAFGTVRGRAGIAIDRVLLYTTAGLAWTSAKDSLDAAAGGLTITNLISISATKVGWTVGAGIEVAILGGLSAKLEYLYVQTDQITGTAPVPFILGGGTVTETATLHDSIVRTGLSYRF
jgi:outer membrane immunogenic protein